MKCIKLFLLCSVLLSCSRVSTTTRLVEDAKETLVELEKSIPGECMSETTKNSLRGLKMRLTEINESCSLEMRAIKEELSKKDIIIAMLTGIIILCLIGYIKKK